MEEKKNEIKQIIKCDNLNSRPLRKTDSQHLTKIDKVRRKK